MSPVPPESAESADDRPTIGRYIVTGTLGRGAMGTVYRAEDPLIERTVALKVLAIDLHGGVATGFRERFYREAKSAGRLNHPNIVTIYDVGESGDTPYIAMEFLPGRTLRESLDSGVVLPVRKIVDIALLVARGLEYAHQNGVIHRDIKPANIMLARSGTVKIMDFGIALASDAGRTMADAVLGSPKYMAPEQIGGGQADARTDVFALGVTLYEMLTGKDAFGGETIPEVMHKVLHAMPPAPASLNPDIPGELDAIVMRALAKSPDDRFQRAKDMGRALGALRRVLRTPPDDSPDPVHAAGAQDDPAPTTDVPQPQPKMRAANASGRSARRRTGLFASAAVLLLALAGLLLSKRDAPPSRATPEPESSAAASSPLPAADTSLRAPPPIVAFEEGVPETYLAPPPPPAAPARPTPAPRPQQAAAAPARVTLSVLPWGEIHVNGKMRGVSPPLRELELAPGKYRIELRNADFPPRVENLTLESGAAHRIQHRFQ
ncbi:MAG: serine/threonine protein kinase [Rhodocyclaceae bacterium]|jgi:serine/threonine-protein kinase|nr:serine/threonine protein kinase [Rhodocyclaceae bacterium]MCL4758442.1 serine/threonine protein kinase [Rhodocyclaceae bacterium]